MEAGCTSSLLEPPAAAVIPAQGPHPCSRVGISSEPSTKGHFTLGIPPRGSAMAEQHHHCCQRCRRDWGQHPWGGDTEHWQRLTVPQALLEAEWNHPLALSHWQAAGKYQPRFTCLLSKRGFPAGQEQAPGIAACCGCPYPRPCCAVLSIPSPSRSLPRCPQQRGRGAWLWAGDTAAFHVPPQSSAHAQSFSRSCDLEVNYGCQVWGSQEGILEGGRQQV